jgi:hypothetical protein
MRFILFAGGAFESREIAICASEDPGSPGGKVCALFWLIHWAKCAVQSQNAATGAFRIASPSAPGGRVLCVYTWRAAGRQAAKFVLGEIKFKKSI